MCFFICFYTVVVALETLSKHRSKGSWFCGFGSRLDLSESVSDILGETVQVKREKSNNSVNLMVLYISNLFIDEYEEKCFVFCFQLFYVSI